MSVTSRKTISQTDADRSQHYDPGPFEQHISIVHKIVVRSKYLRLYQSAHSYSWAERAL